MSEKVPLTYNAELKFGVTFRYSAHHINSIFRLVKHIPNSNEVIHFWGITIVIFFLERAPYAVINNVLFSFKVHWFKHQELIEFLSHPLAYKYKFRLVLDSLKKS